MQKKTLKKKGHHEQDFNNRKKVLKQRKKPSEQDRNNVANETNCPVPLHFKNSVTQIQTKQILSDKHKYSVISKEKIDTLFSVLKKQKKPNVYEKRIDQCLLRLHRSAKSPWNSPSVILKAMKSSVIQRKWENLTQLLLMFIHLPCVKYRPIIRHMCEILDKHHPIIQQKGLHNQFNTISLAHKTVKKGDATFIK